MCALNGGIPDDDTIFSTVMTQFPYKSNNKIKTVEFLEASKGVVELVDRLGKVFAAVRYDMNGNINKLTKKYEEDKEKHFYLEDMIMAENADGRNIVATDALMWLRRALDFMCRFFKQVLEDNEKKQCLSTYMKTAYAETLDPYHGWMGSQLFNIMVRFSPSRSEFISVLALNRPNKTEQVLSDMQIFNDNLRKCVKQLKIFYTVNNYETNLRV